MATVGSFKTRVVRRYNCVRAGRTLVATSYKPLDGGATVCYIFSGGVYGQHSITCSTYSKEHRALAKARLDAHWEGYCEATRRTVV